MGFETLNTEETNPSEKTASMTDGYGFDTVIVAAGAPQALRSAGSLVSKGGQIIVEGIFPEEVPLAASDLVRKQVSMRGAYASNWKHYEEAIRLLENKQVRANLIITHSFDLDRADEAFQMAKAKTGCKVQFQN